MKFSFGKNKGQAQAPAAADAEAERSRKKLEVFDFSGDIAVSVKDVDLYYGDFQALKNIFKFLFGTDHFILKQIISWNMLQKLNLVISLIH